MTGDYFPWIVGGVWTLLLTMVSDSTIPAVLIGCIEIVFYIYNTMLARSANAPVQPESLSRDLMELWENCLTYSPDGPQAWLEGWFYDAPLDTLSKQDLLEFLAWGSCSTTWDLLTDTSKDEIRNVYDVFERHLKRRFPEAAEGQEPAPFMRFSIEPFEYKHKPTSYYWVCSFLLGLAGKAALYSEGFQRHRSRALDYWIRIPDSEDARRRTPIIFVHGIGVGLVMYLNLIRALVTNDCPVVCIELPFISSKLGACEVPSIGEQVASVESLCKRWGFEKAMFVGHSYGSVMLSWMTQHLPSRVAGLAFIDPVVLMLNLKDVLYNFLYKDEGGDGIADIIGTELGVNIALRRNFWWYRNILWACDLQRHALPTVVCLSEQDEIGPALAVEKHIEQHKAASAIKGQRSVVESYMMMDATHGGFLFSPELLKGLCTRIAAHYDKVQTTSRTAVASRSRAQEQNRRRHFSGHRSKSAEHLDALLH
jgi:pimeloyl-ACP methyl ester carboxylesterase